MLKFAKMVETVGLLVLNEKMMILEHEENKIYKFLGIEQADAMKMKEVSHRSKKMYIIVEQFSRKMSIIIKTKLNKKNLVTL